MVKQVEDAYKSINELFDKYYHDIIKLSILDFIDEDEEDNYIENDLKIIEKKSKDINEIKNKQKKIKIKKNIEQDNNNIVIKIK